MGLQLLIPRSAMPKVLRCTVPGCRGGSEGPKEFPLDQVQQFQRHVKACAKRNVGEMERIVDAQNDTYFTSSADPELVAHLRAGGN